MDIAPATRGHLLVAPKVHAPNLVDLDPDDGARMFQVAQQLAQALRDSSIPAEGINLFLADGEVALQEIFHAHLHVLPRTRGTGSRWVRTSVTQSATSWCSGQRVAAA